MICIRERHYLASLKYENITSPMAQGSGRAPWAWPGSAQGWSVGAPAECYHEGGAREMILVGSHLGCLDSFLTPILILVTAGGSQLLWSVRQ